MNEPQSTTDAGPVPVPDPETPNAPAPGQAADGAPQLVDDAAGEAPRDADTSEDTLAEHVARTDAALVAWRQDAERRRAAWQESQAKAEAQMRAQRRKVVKFATVTGLLGIGLGFVAGAWFTRTWWSEAPAPPAAELAPPPSATAAAPPVAPAPTPAPPELQVAPVPAPEVSAPAAPALDVIDGSARVWSEGNHTWASFHTHTQGDLFLRYLDGASHPALDPMECQAPGADGVRKCSAGRSDARIRAAVGRGAAAGTWTVEACVPGGCVPIGTFEVAG